MERFRGEESIKKGPWTAEEDEVLVKFVNKYGPRDWSSIRTMGLLPRTGKSCRLRWVNKLRPNLKIGCKFTSEEERLVIELQERVGNKWATIASHLPGRTDNDVKNFWSTRQKRLARILQPHSSSSSSTSTTTNKSQNKNNKGKALQQKQKQQEEEAVVLHQTLTLQASEFSFSKLKDEESFSNCHSCSSSSMANTELLQTMPPPPEMKFSNLINIDSNLPSLNISEDDDTNKSISDTTPLTLSFTQLPNTRTDTGLLPECQDTTAALGLAETNFLDVPQLNIGSPFPELEAASGRSGVEKGENENVPIPESFFDELPADLFDFLEQFPSSSPI